MMYVIFKTDGSLDKVNLDEFIQQGSTGVNVIFTTIQGWENISASMSVLLPNSQTTTLLSVPATHTIDGVSYTGFDFTLTNAATSIAGTIKPTLQIVQSTKVLVSYPISLIVNETGVYDNSETTITNAQLRQMLAVLSAKQDTYGVNNVRGYKSLSDLQADTNLVDNQIELYKNTNGNLEAKIKNGSSFDELKIENAILSDKAVKDQNGNVINTYYTTLSTNQNISGKKVFTTLPETQAGRTYTSGNDRQFTDKEYVDTEVGSVADDLDAEELARQQADTNLQNGIDGINAKIPSQASSSNQLADKDFVNSTVNSLASFYITKNASGDPFSTYAELSSATVFYSGGEVRVPTRNDYCLVNADETHDNKACRYIYQGNQWEFQFVVNNAPFTAAQLAAINSGITDVLVAQITTNKNNITTLDNEKLDITDAENDYQSKIVHKDITILSTDWSNNEFTTTFSNFVVGVNDTVLCSATDILNETIIATYGVKLYSISTTNDITTAVFKCIATPSESVSVRLLLIKENVIPSDSSVLTSASVDNTTIEYANSVLKVKDNVFNEKLVSGTNIKTVNGNSLLGSGNITIGGGTSQIYKHKLTMEIDNGLATLYGFLEIINGSVTPITLSTLLTAELSGKPFSIYDGDDTTGIVGLGLYSAPDEIFAFIPTYLGTGLNIVGITDVTDTVEEL